MISIEPINLNHLLIDYNYISTEVLGADYDDFNVLKNTSLVFNNFSILFEKSVEFEIGSIQILEQYGKQTLKDIHFEKLIEGKLYKVIHSNWVQEIYEYRIKLGKYNPSYTQFVELNHYFSILGKNQYLNTLCKEIRIIKSTRLGFSREFQTGLRNYI